MNQEDYISENEKSIRLSDLIELGKAYFFYALKHWWIGLIAGLIGAGVYFYKAYTTPPSYTAKLSFILSENTNSGGGGFANILSEFGLSDGKKGVNMNRIIDLLDSREIVGRALFAKAEFLEKTDFLANHYIYIFKLHDIWKDTPNEALYDFYFDHDSIPTFSELENSVFKGLKGRVSNMHLRHEITDGDMFIIRVTSASEFMSYELANKLYKVLSDYYVEKTIEKNQETFEIVQSRTDSLEMVLRSTEARLAKFQDSNRSIFKKESFLKEERLQRDVAIASSLFQQSAINLESTRMSLLSSKPIIQPVDQPIYPLRNKFPEILPEMIKGGLIGGVFALLLLFGFKFISDLLDRERKEMMAEETI